MNPFTVCATVHARRQLSDDSVVTDHKYGAPDVAVDAFRESLVHRADRYRLFWAWRLGTAKLPSAAECCASSSAAGRGRPLGNRPSAPDPIVRFDPRETLLRGKQRFHSPVSRFGLSVACFWIQGLRGLDSRARRLFAVVRGSDCSRSADRLCGTGGDPRAFVGAPG